MRLVCVSRAPVRAVAFLAVFVTGTLGLHAQTPPPQQPPAPQPPQQQAPAPPQQPQQPPATPPAPGAPTEAQQPTFKSGIDVVSLNVTVTDGATNKAFVRDLERGEFAVFEDGVKQDLTFFTRASLPIALSLLIDTSASMEDKIGTAQEAAVGFVKRLRPNDLGQIIDFDNRVTILQNFTSEQPALEQAIRRSVANGSTSLHNAIYISLKELKKVRAKDTEDIRRQAIVVLSDGEDTSSLVPFEEVLELAKRSEVAIYTIAIRGKDITARGFNEAEFVLRQFAQETGGRSFFPGSVNELEGIYAQIGEELASQYTLAYVSRNPRRDGRWRRVVVRTTRPNAIARTKQGYYGPTE